MTEHNYNESENGKSSSSGKLHFDVSTGLKRVIGRDLITDDEVAIFELVKNSFDASASFVQIRFGHDSIWIVDNGEGMSLDDLTKKWLFVAYSSKRGDKPESFRQQIAQRRHFAGSKGIGRFSSDRLGRRLLMQTRAVHASQSGVHQVEVNWDSFEYDDTKLFGTVPVNYAELREFALPTDLDAPKHGTAINIQDVRVEWNRARILHLKASLAKLINPFGATTDAFRIIIVAPSEHTQDHHVLDDAKAKDVEPNQNQIANGEVGNFIFSTLQEKTTFLDVSFSQQGKNVISKLTDRGELVYQILESNPFNLLQDSDFSCQLFYLNRSAKMTFARRMGLPSVQFGSIFLFRNGFRVYPIGEDGDDWFGIARRKQQGYRRFLGTRDVIGKIEVSGSENEFKEASSRNQGLIQTRAVSQLRECFWEYCLKRLERYVVPVSWPDKAESFSDDLSRLMTDTGRARVAAAVARLVDNPDVRLLDYSRKLITVLNERSSQFEESLSSLRSIANKTDDTDLFASIDQAEQRFRELKAAEAEALMLAEKERNAKKAAQAEVEKALAAAERAAKDLTEERKRTLFLTSITSLDTQTIINMHHQITIYAADLKQQIENCLAAAREGDISTEGLVARLEQVAFLNQKVLAVSRLATKANFRLESDSIEEDLAAFIEGYVNEIASPFLGTGIAIHVDNFADATIRRFRPMEIAIIVDNLVNNARKARASEIRFQLNMEDKATLAMEVRDNGTGLPVDLDDPEKIFELGFSRTSGSGLGLYHVRYVLGEIGGSISTVPSESGASFLIRIAE